MKRTFEIQASFTGTIPKGSFENEKPFYSLKEIITLEEGDTLYDEEVIERQKLLHEICYQQFQKQSETAYLDRIKKEYQNIRFYGDYPSVTSIIGWDADFRISQEELSQYGARGTIKHKQAEIYLTTGEWLDPLKIPEVYPELVIVRKGSLRLSMEGFNFIGFYKDYPFKVIDVELEVINDKHRYGGRLDIICVIESSNKGKWDKIEGVLFDVPTILDIKTGQIDKAKHLSQQTAYWHCEKDVKQVGLIPLNDSTQQGFSKPIIETDRDRWWPFFLDKREKFKQRYGV